MKYEFASYLQVDYNDLEREIQQFFGWPDYEIIPAQEWNNDTYHVFDTRLSDWEIPHANRDLEAKNYSFRLSYIMWAMAEKGVIPHGDYLIHVSW